MHQRESAIYIYIYIYIWIYVYIGLSIYISYVVVHIFRAYQTNWIPMSCVVVSKFIAQFTEESNLARALEMKHAENRAFKTRALDILNIPWELKRRVISDHYYQKMSHDTHAVRALFDEENLGASLWKALKVSLTIVLRP